jgi:hypothetical protein
MTEAEIGEAWLAWERAQVKAGRRPALPCDIDYSNKVESLSIDQIAVLTSLRVHGAQTSVELATRLGYSSHQIANFLVKPIRQRKARKIGMTARSDTRRESSLWVYEAVQ